MDKKHSFYGHKQDDLYYIGKYILTALFAIAFCLVFFRIEVVAAASSKNIPISSSNKVVVIRTSYATGEFDESWGGVMMAVPNKDSDVYELYDVVIWSDRISLYKFPGNINDAFDEYYEKNVRGKAEFSPDMYAKSWREFRETCCLDYVMVKTSEDNPKRNSSRRLAAYKSFFNIIKARTNSKHIVIKYSGHGMGTMFCGNLNDKDTVKILKYGTRLFGNKFSVIDYGTNCQSGITSVLNMYKDYTDYMIVSQLDVGGFTFDDDEDCKKFYQVDTDAVYDKMFVSGETAKNIALRMANQHAIEWQYAANNLKKDNNPQSVTVVDMEAYKKLLKIAGKYYKPGQDLYKCIKKAGKKSVLKKYNKAIIFYDNDKKQIGKWKKFYGNGITCG
ncbi:hypothetical protein [Butyrivibrio sp. WCD3002]|uniref:hypothetical protein n=1 Tax=Butyrivibrio sp. WCD3002 TaxID=1280676 RepID=UPI0003FE13C5|nr:hypothetical protein [Butyrivibrio sp. WCD3002]